jgi:hypothetical protein
VFTLQTTPCEARYRSRQLVGQQDGRRRDALIAHAHVIDMAVYLRADLRIDAFTVTVAWETPSSTSSCA